MASLDITRTVNDGIGALTDTQTVTSGNKRITTVSIPPATTNEALTYSFTNAKLKAFYAKSSTAMTIKTNATGAPQETLTLPTGTGFVWSASGACIGTPGLSPFAGNVTALFVTNAGAATGTLEIRDMTDPVT